MGWVHGDPAGSHHLVRYTTAHCLWTEVLVTAREVRRQVARSRGNIELQCRHFSLENRDIKFRIENLSVLMAITCVTAKIKIL